MNPRGVNDYRPPVSEVFSGTPFGELLARRTPEDRKRDGQRRVLDHAGEWKDEALELVRDFLLTLPDGSLVCGDDWRYVIPTEPPHHNAWGALAGQIARLGWLEWTGDYTTSRQKQGHANVVKRWKVCRAAVARGVPSDARRGAA